MTDESKPTSVKDIRDGIRHTVTSPDTGRTYLIRDFEGVDAFRMDALPDMVSEDGEVKMEHELSSTEREKLNLDWTERVVCLCCLEPEVTRDPDKASDTVLYVDELGDEIAWLCDQILEKYEGKVQTSRDSQQKNSST